MGGKVASQWKQKAQQIRTNRDNHIQEIQPKIKKLYIELNLSPEKQQALLNAPVTELVTQLNSGKTTSYQLVVLFASRCATIGLTKCWITEQNFDEAIREARQCDETRSRTKHNNCTADNRDGQLSQLFGVPLSVKDTVDMKGFASTIGATSRYDFKYEDDGVVLHVLRKAGMIPFVKSNIPQLTLTMESVNPMFGRAVNPWDETRAVGGSSGGEAAMVAGRCSPIGIGSDIGGSLRIPAEFCGVYSLKPSSRRYSILGHTFYAESLGGGLNVPAVVGPIGKSVEDLALFVSVLTDEKYSSERNTDVFIKLVPFDYKLYRQVPTKLRIGYFHNLELIPTTPASIRAVKIVTQRLEKLGHEVIEVRIPREDDVIGVFFELLSADGGLRGFKTILKGESFIEEYSQIEKVFGIPSFLHSLASKLILKLKKRLGFIVSKLGKKSAREFLVVSYQQQKLKQEFIQMWRDKNLDFIICPGFGSQALKHGFSKNTSLAAAYTSIWNILEMTVGQMPVTKVQESEVGYGRYHDDLINQFLLENSKGSQGLPVGIQVVGLPYQEERVLGFMKIIEKEFPFYKENSFPI